MSYCNKTSENLRRSIRIADKTSQCDIIINSCKEPTEFGSKIKKTKSLYNLVDLLDGKMEFVKYRKWYINESFVHYNIPIHVWYKFTRILYKHVINKFEKSKFGGINLSENNCIYIYLDYDN